MKFESPPGHRAEPPSPALTARRSLSGNRIGGFFGQDVRDFHVQDFLVPRNNRSVRSGFRSDSAQ